MPGEIMAKITAKGGRPESVVIAGLDPAIPIAGHGRCLMIGMAGSSPAMTASKDYRENFLYLSRCGMIESVPSRRILSAS
jgi:hypothetical protein